MTPLLTSEMAARLAEVALSGVTREFPNKLDHVLTGPHDLRRPRDLHPIFYGSFDWHSCVHGYWTLVRLHRRFPDLPQRAGIAALVDEHITPGNVEAELAYLDQPMRRTFERPYGMAWLLMLGSELMRGDDEQTTRWRRVLTPLLEAFADRLRDYLAAARYPVRAGVHSNSAFALILALEYARASRDGTLADAICAKARTWYADDADCPAWEPDGEDFLSPALTEALCMARVLPNNEFAQWRERFLPRLREQQPAALFAPAEVSDRTDLRISHLDGLNLSRAWCWRHLAQTFADDDARRAHAAAAARAHVAASLPHIADDYAGSHWLASFALLALDV
ncbi:MAG TPA: DUF2891 domain-containing protein [Xanthobacteraceae bacterium]|nr:DUF2891 domain-containing protein [Xanthobacteraceae bacterium]